MYIVLGRMEYLIALFVIGFMASTCLFCNTINNLMLSNRITSNLKWMITLWTTMYNDSIGKRIDCYIKWCLNKITYIYFVWTERRVANGEASHTSPIAGKTFVLVRVGGAGRALAFGAKSRGAQVVIFNQNYGNKAILFSPFYYYN